MSSSTCQARAFTDTLARNADGIDAVIKNSKEATASAHDLMDNLDKRTAEISANTNTLMKTATTPWQMEASLYSLAQMAVSHIWYHDGQLNYIQCLMGDGDYHWSH